MGQLADRGSSQMAASIRFAGRSRWEVRHQKAGRHLLCAPEQRQVWRTILAGRQLRGAREAGTWEPGTREVGALVTHMSCVMCVA